jgi:hypothetical protein
LRTTDGVEVVVDDKKEGLVHMVAFRATLRLMFSARFTMWFPRMEVNMERVHARTLQYATAEVPQTEDKADPWYGLLEAWTIAATPAMQDGHKFSRMMRFHWALTELNLLSLEDFLVPVEGSRRVWPLKATAGGRLGILMALENLQLWLTTQFGSVFRGCLDVLILGIRADPKIWELFHDYFLLVQVNALICDIAEDLHAPGIRSDRFPGASRASPTESRCLVRCYVEVFWRRFVKTVHGSAPSLSINMLLASNSARSRGGFYVPEGVERARLMSDRLTMAFELQPRAVAYASSLFQMVALSSVEAKKKVPAAPKGAPDDVERSRSALKRERKRAAKALKKQTETPVAGGAGFCIYQFLGLAGELTRDGVTPSTCHRGPKFPLATHHFDSLQEAKLRVTPAMIALIPRMERVKEQALKVLNQP